jgi:serine/threonine protein kinase
MHVQSNIFIDREHRAKIADFGLTIVGDETQARYTTTGSGSGSEGWKAPERYYDKSRRARRETPIDVFAFGLVCVMVSCLCPLVIALTTLTSFQLITGKSPYGDMTAEIYLRSVVFQHRRPELKDVRKKSLGNYQMSDDLWRMITNCWPHNPKKRLSMQQVVALLRPGGIAPSNEHSFYKSANCDRWYSSVSSSASY